MLRILRMYQHFPSLCHAYDLTLRLISYVSVSSTTASLDPGNSVDFIAHRILLGAGIYGIENVNYNIDKLPNSGFSLIVMPMKLMGGSGAPARVVATIPL